MTDAPNYNDGLWHGWNGGECPVAKGTLVQVRGEGDVVWAPQDATEDVYWPNVIVFRVVKPAPPQPRTIYLCEFRDGERSFHATAIDATKAALAYGHGATVSEWEEKL